MRLTGCLMTRQGPWQLPKNLFSQNDLNGSASSMWHDDEGYMFVKKFGNKPGLTQSLSGIMGI